MKYSKWIGLLAAATIICICYTVWVTVPSAQLQIGGMRSSGQHNFGRPGMLNIVFSIIAAILFILPQIWAKRTNIFFCAFNLAWATRNYILLSRCYSGDCPIVNWSLYILVIAGIVMLIMSFLPDVEIKDDKKPLQHEIAEKD